MAVRFPHLTGRNLSVIGCCVGVALVTVLLGPILQIHEKSSMDLQIAESRERVQVLKSAAALQQQMQKRVTDLEAMTGTLSAATGRLSSERADQVLTELHRLADQAEVNLIDVRPNLQSMGLNSTAMEIKATIHGNMTGFQSMLSSLLQVPYVQRLQHLLVSAEPEGLQLITDFTVHIQ